MPPLLITVMIVDVIENWVCCAASRRSRAHWGPRGWDKWEIWETTASREGRWDCRYCPFHPSPSPPHPDDCTCMQNDSSTCWFAPGNTRGVFGLLKRNNNNFLSIQIIRTLTHCCVSIFSQPSFPFTVWASVNCRRILQTRQTVCLVNN